MRPVDHPIIQLHALAARTGLVAIYGPLTFNEYDVRSLCMDVDGNDITLRPGEVRSVLFSDAKKNRIGIIHVTAHDRDEKADGATLGIRGWELLPEVPSALVGRRGKREIPLRDQEGTATPS